MPILSHTQPSSPLPILNFSYPLNSLPPLAPNTQQRTRRTRQTHKPIVKVNPTKGGARNGKITEIANQLDPNIHEFLLQLLRLHNLLRVLGLSESLLALEEMVVRVEARGDGEGEACKPSTVAFAGETGGKGGFANRCCVELGLRMLVFMSVKALTSISLSLCVCVCVCDDQESGIE